MLDRQPAGLLRWLLRLPISLYRWGLGGLLGDRFLLLHHRGRKSGQPRRTALEVIEADRRAGRYLVAAAWGERADWLLNLRAEPQVEIEVGGRRWPARASELTLDQARAAFDRYQRQHPLASQALGPVLGYDLRQVGDRQRMAERVPVVALTVTETDRTEDDR
jgi:deazaflavin-dependent oxidoreductase (nitroreductase family)